MRWLWLLAALAPLAGCVVRLPSVTGCGPAEARVENASGLAVEQLYLAPVGAAGWGADLIGRGELASGGALPLRFAGAGPYALRAVWVNGQAVEMPRIDGCTVKRILLLDGGMRAE